MFSTTFLWLPFKPGKSKIMNRNVRGGVVDWPTGYMMLAIFTIPSSCILISLFKPRKVATVSHARLWLGSYCKDEKLSCFCPLNLHPTNYSPTTQWFVVHLVKKKVDIFSSAFELGLIWISCFKCRTIKTILDSSSIYLIITYLYICEKNVDTNLKTESTKYWLFYITVTKLILY